MYSIDKNQSAISGARRFSYFQNVSKIAEKNILKESGQKSKKRRPPESPGDGA
jgi:hypothetical protein